MDLLRPDPSHTHTYTHNILISKIHLRSENNTTSRGVSDPQNTTYSVEDPQDKVRDLFFKIKTKMTKNTILDLKFTSSTINFIGILKT